MTNGADGSATIHGRPAVTPTISSYLTPVDKSPHVFTGVFPSTNFGNNQIDFSNQEIGISVQGDGIRIIKLPTYGSPVDIRGSLPAHADVKIVTSPMDLTKIVSLDRFLVLSDFHDPVWVGPAYLIYELDVENRSDCKPHFGQNCYSSKSSLPLPVANDADLLGYTGHQIDTSDPTFTWNNDINYEADQSRKDGVREFIARYSSESLIITTENHNGDLQITDTHVYHTPSEIHRIYSEAPWNEIKHYPNSFQTTESFTIPENAYIIVDLGVAPENSLNEVKIKVSSSSNNPYLLEILDSKPNMPYQIVKEGHTLFTGLTDANGRINIENNDENLDGITENRGGVLLIYPDSLGYRGSFSTVVMDRLNMNTLHLDTQEDKIYVVHAYATIPATGDITVDNLRLVQSSDRTIPALEIEYLNRNYSDGELIYVPVIPGYNTILLDINELETSLMFSSILGGTGLKIADSVSSTITKNSPIEEILSAEAVAGTMEFVFASGDGTLNAQITETITGHMTISNGYVIQVVPDPPPPPPPPPRIDPLEGYVDIYVNGVKRQPTIELGINHLPDFKPAGTVADFSITRSVTYDYADYTLSRAVSIPVKTGDFVEFYVYGKISGAIDGYSAPSGFFIASESGVSTATVEIKSASILTSQ